MNILKTILTLLIIFLIVVAVLFVDFTYKTFSYRQPAVKADAIVVLAGGKGRIEEGTKLYREGKSKKLFLIGVDPTVSKKDLYHPTGNDPSAEMVVLEKASRNTLENAVYGRALIMQSGVSSILLITSRYHMKRAAILFRNALPKDVSIYPYPVDSDNFKESWWSHSGSFRLLFREFYKYCMFRLFFMLTPNELRNNVIS